jgi:ABC-type lipoprotein export system ATPase subunit
MKSAPLRPVPQPESGDMVRVTNVRKSFRQGTSRVEVLRGVSFEVSRGHFLSIMGPSGSGKSTLLHLLGGLDVPDDGTVVVGGHSFDAMSDDELTLFRRRRIGFVFQFFNLLPALTAEENVALPLLLDGKRLRDVQDDVAHLLERVGLGHRRRHRAEQLSGGEMQRVAIARALVAGPALLLADEPTGNLDSRTSEEILRLIRTMVEESGQTVIMITHDRHAAAYGQRVLHMRDGCIVTDASALEQRSVGGGGEP